jgi:hypothetical protein
MGSKSRRGNSRQRPARGGSALVGTDGVPGGRLALALLDLAGSIAWLAASFKLPVVGVDHLLNRFPHLRPDALDLFRSLGKRWNGYRSTIGQATFVSCETEDRRQQRPNRAAVRGQRLLGVK